MFNIVDEYWYAYWGKSTVDSPHQSPVMRSFDLLLLWAWTCGWTNRRDTICKTKKQHHKFRHNMVTYKNVHQYSPILVPIVCLPCQHKEWCDEMILLQRRAHPTQHNSILVEVTHHRFKHIPVNHSSLHSWTQHQSIFGRVDHNYKSTVNDTSLHWRDAMFFFLESLKRDRIFRVSV